MNGIGQKPMSIHPLEPIPAIRRLETDRPDLFAVEIAGHVSGADVENLFGLLEGAYALHDRIDLLMRFTDHDGVDWDGVAPATLAEGSRHAGRHVVRCAAIGDTGGARRFARIFAPSPDGETRRFPADREQEAWTWLGAREVAEDV